MPETTVNIIFLILAVSFAVPVLFALFKLVTTPYRRRIVRHAVISNLTAVMQQDLPLPTALHLAAYGETGAARRIVARIAGLLSNGLSLSEAIRLGFPNCPAIALSLIVAGERSGRLADAAKQAHRTLLDEDGRSSVLQPGMALYAVAVVASIGAALTFTVMLIVPKLEEIGRDFGAPLPKLLETVTRVSQHLVSGALPAMLVPLAVLLLIAGVYFKLRPRRIPVPYRTTRIADSVRWHTPGLRALCRAHAMATVFECLCGALRSGAGLPEAAQLASTVDVNWFARKRMALFAELLSRGANVSRAATQAKLGPLATGALQNGQRTGDLDAALRFLADYHAGLVGRWWLVCRNLAWPLLTLVLGTVVGIFALCFFSPLTALIEHVCEGSGL
jgi:type II secretory pathway component PulF